MEQIKQIHAILLEMFEAEDDTSVRQTIEDILDKLDYLRYQKSGE